VWRAFRGFRSEGHRPLSLGHTLLLSGELTPGRGEWFDDEVKRLRDISRLRAELRRAEGEEFETLMTREEQLKREQAPEKANDSDDDDAPPPTTVEDILARWSRRITRKVAVCFRWYVKLARGIFTTFAKSGGRIANIFRPTLIVVDEGSQATEGRAIYPLVNHVATWRHVLLVGDHLQLPPCVTTKEAVNPFQHQCEISLFERLIGRRLLERLQAGDAIPHAPEHLARRQRDHLRQHATRRR
jgi:hypothetical protein